MSLYSKCLYTKHVPYKINTSNIVYFSPSMLESWYGVMTLNAIRYLKPVTCCSIFSFLTANHHHHHWLATSCISGHSSISVSNSVFLLHILTLTKNFTFKFANSFMMVTITFVSYSPNSNWHHAWTMWWSFLHVSGGWTVECHIFHLNYPISNPTTFQNSSPFTNWSLDSFNPMWTIGKYE